MNLGSVPFPIHARSVREFTSSQRCAGVPASVLIAVLSQLPRLKDLRLKGAPASSIPTIISFLPDLRSLDTEFLLGSQFLRRQQFLGTGSPPSSAGLPVLVSLTVRTSMDTQRAQSLWEWMKELVPRPGLETLKVYAYRTSMVHFSLPRMFLLEMALLHGDTLKHFIAGDVQLTLADVCPCQVVAVVL